MKQKDALEILKTGKSAFITGAAGSGKTYLLNQYIKFLRDTDAEVGITASTGIASTHMGGITIHAWAGIGVRQTITEYDIDELKERRYLRDRLRSAQVLIVDEISMLHHFRLDMVDKVLRHFKEVDQPFGGVQVIFCGDFFQLPPVSRYDEEPALFAYHSESWKELDPAVLYLEEQFRQNDEVYTEILNAIRENRIGDVHKEHLISRLNKRPSIDIEPARLYAHNADVDSENGRELDKIPGEVFSYKMSSRGNEKVVAILKQSCLAPDILRLKKGSRVMFLKNNFEEGYANGTLGVVEDCSPHYVKVRTGKGKLIDVEPDSWRIEDSGKTIAEITQYPLRLAWAITVHKSQGMSLDAAHIDLSKSFEKGMGYVALSRVRSLGGLSLAGMNDTALKVSDEALEWDEAFREKSAVTEDEWKKFSDEEIAKMQEKYLGKLIPTKEKKKKKVKVDTVSETKIMIGEGKTLKEIARLRALTYGTIMSHAEKIKELDPHFDLSPLKKEMSQKKMLTIILALKKCGMEGGQYRLSPAKEMLGDKVTFDEIRLARLLMK